MRCLAIAFLLVLGGCVAEGTVQELPPNSAFSASVPIRLVPFDSQRADPFTENGKDYFIRTGPFWTQVFSSSESIDETFAINNARMDDRGARNKYLFTYSVEGEFSCGGNSYPIKAQGSRSAQVRVEKAKQDAIQRAILSVVDSIQKHLEHCQDDSQTELAAVDMYDELVKLKDLLDKGILTEAEFEVAKSRVLGKR